MKHSTLINIEKSIIVPTGELRSLIDDIVYRELPLSHPKRKKQREQFYIVLNHLFLHHFYLKQRTKDPYLKKLTHYEFKELGSNYMRSKVGSIWDSISKILIEKNIIERNDDNPSKGSKSDKKTTKNFSGTPNNSLGRPFAMCYRLNLKWQDYKYWQIETIGIENKLDPVRIRDEKGDLLKCQITIDVNKAIKELESLKKKMDWSPVMHKIYLRKVALFNYSIFKDRKCRTGRVFNKVNCLPSKLREHVKICDIPMKELDIKSCLPNILYKYIENPVEQKLWLEQISKKRLYLYFAVQCGWITSEGFNKCTTQEDKNIYKSSGIDKAKSAMCCYLGGKRAGTSMSIDNVLKKCFPILHKRIKEIESKGETKGELSRLLQNTESKIVVEGMADEPYPTISIHDGVGVAETYIEDAYSSLHELFEYHVGCPCIITGFTPQETTVIKY